MYYYCKDSKRLFYTVDSTVFSIPVDIKALCKEWWDRDWQGNRCWVANFGRVLGGLGTNWKYLELAPSPQPRLDFLDFKTLKGNIERK